MVEHVDEMSPVGQRMTVDRRLLWSFVRLAVGALLATAVVSQFVSTVTHAAAEPEPYASHLPTVIANFFSYFTMESNTASALLLATAAIWAWTRGRHGGEEPKWLTVLFACVTTYMLLTSVVYNVLLRGTEDPETTVWWANEVLHVWGPLFLLADAFLAQGRRRLPWRTLWIIVGFPIAWAVYTLLRANAITSPGSGNPWWYPYPFLDPHLQGGYGGVALYIVGIAAAMCAVGSLVVALTRLRDRRPRELAGSTDIR